MPPGTFRVERLGRANRTPSSQGGAHRCPFVYFVCRQCVLVGQSRWTDSNRQPADYKSAALPIELYRRIAPYPQRCILLPHCQTAAFSGFSLDWFSGYQQEEDSFVLCMRLSCNDCGFLKIHTLFAKNSG